MNNEVIKPGLIKRIVDKLADKKIVIGGNKQLYTKKYHLQYTQEIVDNVLTAYLQTLEDIIEDGDTVVLNGYMTVEPKYWKARKARNVYAGENIEVPAKYRVRIKPGIKLERACNRFNEKKL